MSAKAKFQPVPSSPSEETRDDATEYDPDFMCGFYGFRPRWLQRFAKPYYFLVSYVLFGIFQGALKAHLNGCLTTIEKKFALSGRMVGVVLIADNISSLFASLLIGFYATKLSRPKIIVFGIWMAIAGCFLSVLPYLVYGPGISGAVQSNGGDGSTVGTAAGIEYCTSEESRADVEKESSSPVALAAVSMLFIANMLSGVGGSAFYIAGSTYTDDNIKKKNSPLYFSVIMSVRLIGPMLGYLAASFCLSIYESPFENPGITNKHPSWIGAWWLGFVIWGSSMVVMSLPMSLFPKNIRKPPGSLEKAPVHDNNVEQKPPKSLGEKLLRDLKDFTHAVRRLSKNPVLMWKLISLVFIYNGLGGYVSMFPKYIEHQYRVSASKASLFTGPTKVMAMMFGIFFGGIIIRIWKPRATTIGFMAAFCECITVAFLVATMFLGCNNWQLAGSQMNPDGSFSIMNPCNAECGCSTRAFQPVCDVPQGATYFSPCFAGCFDRGNGSVICSCVSGNGSSVLDPPQYSPSVEDGFCEFPCTSKLYIVVLLMSIGNLIGQLSRVGSALVTLRCVDPTDKGMAIGMMAFCINFLAAIPYPLIYSAIFDHTCLVWEERGGQRGNCWFFDMDKLRVTYHGVTIAFLSFGLFCQLIMAYYARRVTNMYDDNDSSGGGDATLSRTEDSHELKQLKS